MTAPAARQLRLEFVTEGIPAGQGRLTSYGRGKSVWSNEKLLKPWREKIASDALYAMDGMPLLQGGVALYLAFTVRRPQRPKYSLPIVKGLDWDHAGRAVSDALSGVVYDDDAQVIEGHVSKRYEGDFGELKVPGVRVLVFEVTA